MKVKKVKQKILWVVISLLTAGVLVSGGIVLVKFIQNAAFKNLANVAWYDEDGDEFTISTSKELYEFAKLSQYYDFKDQTVKLDADIVLNEGNADEWEEAAPENLWYPITGFAGTFDGQGHTISGVYGKTLHSSMGLFTDTQKDCKIKDLRLINSYFYNVSHMGTGSIIGSGAGKLESIYSDAKIVNHGFYTGGMIGNVNEGGEIRVSNSWFDGEIELKSYVGRFAGGIVGNVKLVGGIVTIEHCLNTGTITCDSPMSPNVGGIVGAMQAGGTVNITDTLNVGTITTTGGIYGIGSIIGRVVDNNPKLQIKSTYATNESYTSANGGSAARVTGRIICMSEKELSGFSSYRWTELDFDRYWTVVVDKTPVLKYFTEDQVSIEGIAKAFNTSWYDPEATTYIISTKEDLYGMQMLSQTNDFQGKTFKLRNDIVINEGEAKEWIKNAPEYIWTSIGNTSKGSAKQFQGTFDGQNHTISGMYAVGKSCTGLFGIIGEKGVVKNLKLSNSCIVNESEKASDWGLTGSLVGQLRGKIDTIYVDNTVTIISKGAYAGGIVGLIRKNTTISNCWSAANLIGVPLTAGIVGAANEGTHTIEHCLFSGTVAYEANIAGIIAMVENKGVVKISDTLNVGKIGINPGETKKYGQGSILARVKSGEITLTNVFATAESCAKAVDYPNGKVSGNAIILSEDIMKGKEAYQYTYLDFNKYWAAVSKSTPILKSFAAKPLSVAGLKKKIDFSWYDSSKNVYTIKTKEQLLGFQMISQTETFKEKTIKLGADIKLNDGNAADWANQAPGTVWTSIGNTATGNVKQFQGTFDGQNHTISGMYAVGKSCTGLFGIIGENGVVKNLKLSNSCIVNESENESDWGITGSLVGQLRGKIDTIYVDNTVTIISKGAYAGGIVGQIRKNTTISNCWSAANLIGAPLTAGIVGAANEGTHTIEHCLFSGTVAYEANIAGIIAMVENKGVVKISDTLNVGKIGINPGETKKYGQGSILARVKSGEITLTNVFATAESCAKAVDYPNGKVKGTVETLLESSLLGYGSYDFTELDFDKYWVVVSGKTAELTSFSAGNALSLNGRKKPDTTWYKADEDEFTLTTAAELRGLSVLAKKIDFDGKTIKLGKDIQVSPEWKAGNKAPEYTWDPIGSTTKPFKGTFDGQGHIVSGLYMKASDASGLGMFGVVQDATITNFKLENSYFEASGSHLGSIAGEVGNSTISKIYSNATVVLTSTGAWGRSAGLVGQAYGGTITVSECWFDGTLNMAAGRSAGLVGWVTGATFELEHCLNTGTVESSVVASNEEYVGGLVGGFNNAATSIGTITDCLNAGTLKLTGTTALTGTVFGHLSWNAKVTVTNVYATTNKAYIGGEEVTHQLMYNTAVIDSGSVSDMTGVDLTGLEAFRNMKLDFNTYWAVDMDGTPVLQIFAEEIPELPALTIPNTSWYKEEADKFVLSTAEQLAGVAVLVNEGKTFAGKTILLDKDIVLNEGEAKDWAENPPFNNWIPIGNDTTQFQGTFDGQGYTISGLYAKSATVKTSLFGDVRNAVIKNFSIENSYIESSAYYVSGAVAYTQNSTISNIYSNAIVVSTNTEEQARAAGILSQGDTGTVTISNCWFDGTVTSAGGFNGGIVGRASAVTMNLSHCLNTGTVSSTFTGKNKYTGGIIGGINNANTSIISVSDTLNAGTLKLTGTIASSGTAFGFIGYNAKVTMSNVYATTNKAIIDGKETTHVTNVGSPDTGSISDMTGVDLIGYAGYANTKLDFANYWAVDMDGTPILKLFADEIPELPVIITPDKSWYDDTKTEYVLTTVNQVAGISTLIDEGKTFAGKTIKLGAHIIFNDGDAKAWATNAPFNSWTPIGNSTTPFKGTFDGQGYTISGLYAKSTTSKVSVFGDVRNGSVGNFRVENSYFESSDNYVSGAVAYAQNSTISEIYSNAIVVSTDVDENARAAGILSQGDTGTVTVSNCWFDGTVTSAGGRNGGIVGWASAVTMNISHCLNTGTVSTSYNVNNKEFTGGILGGANNNKNTTLNVSDTLSAGVLKLSGSKGCTGTAFGFLGYNAKVTMSNVYATTSKAIINGVETAHVIHVGSPDTGSVTDLTGKSILGNDAMTNASALDYTTYWSVVSGKIPALKTFMVDIRWYNDSETTFTLTTADELRGLAKLSATNNFAGKTIKLGANIVFDEGNAADWATNAPHNSWTPIGNNTTPFKGTFDGQGYTISGLYAKTTTSRIAVFGDVRNGSVGNFRVENSYFESSDNYVSGAVAYAQNSTISGIYSNAIVVSTDVDEYARAAGILSQGDTGTVTVSNCWFDGTVTSAGGRNGGIVGWAAAVTMNISHCLNTGTVSTSYNSTNKEYTGGILGGANNNANTTLNVSDTLSAGVLKLTGSKSNTGTAFGFLGYNAKVTMSNVYATTSKAVINGVETAHVIRVGSPDTGSVTDLTGISILGDDAKTNAAGLDYENYWITVEGKTPELKQFHKPVAKLSLVQRILNLF